MPFLMPSEEETKINLVFADNQPPLTIDAIEVDNVLATLHSKELPEDISFDEAFIELFQKTYKRKLSKTGVSMLCRVKLEMLEKVKKNLYQPDEPSVSSVPETNSQNATSGFYPL